MSEPKQRKKLIEVALPLEAINRESAREKSIRHGHPSTLHLWWARRPLAAARAVLFAQLVDDPSSWPELFPTEEAQDEERTRLFKIIEEMVPWKASSDQTLVSRARREIARSWARSHPSTKASGVLAADADAEVINEYLATELPAVHDPFAGGGTIPLEAQRLGLRAIASDLNPVAVLINKALIQIPPRFAGMPPVNPESKAVGKRRSGKQARLAGTERKWRGAEGLSQDLQYYGNWVEDEASRRIGSLYPSIEVTAHEAENRPELAALVGKRLQPIAWLWARTIECPNPTCRVRVPLVRSFLLSAKKGRRCWVEPVVDTSTSPPTIRCRIVQQSGDSNDEPVPTISRHGGRCIACDSPIPLSHVRLQGREGHLGRQLLATVSEAGRRRVYLAPTRDQVDAAMRAAPAEDVLTTALPDQALGFRVQAYGLTRHRDLFTDRQLVLLTTFAELVDEVRARVRSDMATEWDEDEGRREEYAGAVATYLGLALSRMANYASCLCFWSSHAKDELVKQVFSRNALVMAPDYAETNPFAGSSGGWKGVVSYVAKAVPSIPDAVPGVVEQRSAMDEPVSRDTIICCDPPYYDNIGYADLSDFFYVWLRLALRKVYPNLTASVLTPKNEELISEPGRFPSLDAAREHFEQGLSLAFQRMREAQIDEAPLSIFYAFKQSDVDASSENGVRVSSSGWEKMLSGLCEQRLSVIGTWPVRTELRGGLRELGRNALASSIVLSCRKRDDNAGAATRPQFRRELVAEIPSSLRALQHGNIAPVDVAQASIGPGMAVFSRHAAVLEADGRAMSVRAALQLINEVLDEYLTEHEGELDADSRFAVTWYEQYAFEAGPFGEAETLAKARAVSVGGVVEAGIAESGGGKVRLLSRRELPDDWDPAADDRLTTWEATQHLIKRLEDHGEEAAAELLGHLGSLSAAARDLAYRLYSACERRGWAEEARAYNGLVVAWPDLQRVAAQRAARASTPTQQQLL